MALKQTIRKQQEDIESYSENMKTKLLTVANIRTLFGNVNYDTQFETLADALKRGLEDRVKKLEAKFNNFRLKKFAPLLETVQALRTYKSKYEASKAIIDELRKKCDDLEATKSENDVLVNHQKKEFESQFIMISELKSQLEESQANLDSLNHQCKEYENKINRLTQRLEDQKVQLETEKAALQKEIDEKRHMANDFEMEKSKLQKDLEKQTLLAEHYKSEFKKKSNELREEQEMKKTVVESLEVSIRHTSNETIKILQNDIDSKNLELEKRANQIEALEKEVSQLKQELKDLSDLPQKTTLLAGENNLLKMTNDELRMKVDELKVIAGEGIKTSEELKNNKEKLEKVENELKKLEKIPELEGIIRSLEEKLIKQNVIIEEYEKENKSSLDQIHMLQSQIQLPDSEIPSYMQVLLGELGEITLDLYKTLMGESEYNRVTSKEYEVADLLSRVKKVVDTQVIRSEDYYDGCTVIAVLIQGSDQEYQIIYTALAEVKVLYLYRSEKK